MKQCVFVSPDKLVSQLLQPVLIDSFCPKTRNLVQSAAKICVKVMSCYLVVVLFESHIPRAR